MLTLSKHNFDAVVSENEFVVISFSAEWCAPCRFFAKVCETVAEQNPDVVFAEVDIEAEPDLAKEFAVRSVPAIMILRRRIVVYADTGALSETQLCDLIENAKSIDIDFLLESIKTISE